MDRDSEHVDGAGGHCPGWHPGACATHPAAETVNLGALAVKVPPSRLSCRPVS
jgi:hypothetical protein